MFPMVVVIGFILWIAKLVAKCCRVNHHSLAFQIPMARTDIYKSSFFPQTIRRWNLLTASFISASECAVDSVTKFTSLVRARN